MLIATIAPRSYFASAAASAGSERKIGARKRHRAGVASIQSALHRGEPGGGGNITCGTNPRLVLSPSRHLKPPILSRPGWDWRAQSGALRRSGLDTGFVPPLRGGSHATGLPLSF